MGVCQVTNWELVAFIIIILTVTFYLLLREWQTSLKKVG